MENNRKKAGSNASAEHASKSHKGTMSHQEAGRLGGNAHHTCRGRQCESAHHGHSATNKNASSQSKSNM